MTDFFANEKIKMKYTMESHCVSEAGTGLLNIGTKQFNENKLAEEFKEDATKNEKQNSKKINAETFYESIKRVGETLGMDCPKFMQLHAYPLF